MAEVEIDLDALSPVMQNEPQQVQDVKVVFVPFIDTELTIDGNRKFLRANVGQKVTRDEARILLEAKKGYVKE